MQVREFQPKMVAIRDASKLEELKEAIKDVPTQPEILVGDEGAIEVARHSEVDAVVTGIVGARSSATMSELYPLGTWFLAAGGHFRRRSALQTESDVTADVRPTNRGFCYVTCEDFRQHFTTRVCLHKVYMHLQQLTGGHAWHLVLVSDR